jgi:hypothetical protein
MFVAKSQGCPECEDSSVYQLEIDGVTYWVARGWRDAHTGHDTAIEFCPFCGLELSKTGE